MILKESWQQILWNFRSAVIVQTLNNDRNCTTTSAGPPWFWIMDEPSVEMLDSGCSVCPSLPFSHSFTSYTISLTTSALQARTPEGRREEDTDEGEIYSEAAVPTEKKKKNAEWGKGKRERELELSHKNKQEPEKTMEAKSFTCVENFETNMLYIYHKKK